MFSKACEYGIRASVFIAIKSRQGVRVSLNEIALGTDSPVSFTAKILQILVKSKIIDSLKGPTGGFEIKNSNAGKIKLSQIVFVIDGDSIYKSCGLGFKNCNEIKPCPLHYKFKTIREDLKLMLEETSLLDLSNDINNGLTFLKRK
ncbi:MAG: Rrf2 family transcriptional regulator [Ignavibacteria bacterium]|nr:Rrf2 family transcriptional regulator [Ignavibacteria bacterium]